MNPSQPFQPQSNPNQNPITPAPVKKRSLLLWIGLTILGLVVVCVVLVGGFAGGYFLVPYLGISSENQPAPESEEAPSISQASSTQVQSLAIQSDGTLHTDDNGVGVQIAPVEGKANQPVNLVSTKLGKDFTKPFEGLYSVESLAYSLSADGKAETARTGTLVFPVKSPDDRLAVIVDQKYVGILSILPENGKLTIDPRVDLVEGDPAHDPSGVDLKFKQYMVVHPKQASLLPAGQSLHVSSSGGLQAIQHEEELTSCGTWYHNYCWRNNDSTVLIFFNKKTNLAYPFLDIMAFSKSVLGEYAKWGFSGAILSARNPLYIIIDGTDSPAYSFKTGNVYMPLDSLSNSDSLETQYALAHELFHWTEDESYIMTINSVSGIDSWWLETAAENAAFMINPEFINLNLKQYGMTQNDGIMGVQLDPFTWKIPKDEARYIHAQNLLVGFCLGNNGCVIDKDYMASTINHAGNPFSSSFAVEKYKQNAIDVARYFLGEAPINGNSEITIPEIAKTGKGLGDYIHGMKAVKGTNIITSSSPNNLTKEKNEVTISAKIPPGDVYPLRVSNGKNAPVEDMPSKAGAPMYLLVEGNQNYFAKTGNGNLIDGSGKGQLMFGPIHENMGIENIRIAAYAQTEPMEFKAKAGIIDLSGDWVGKPIKLISQSQSCPSEDEEEGESNIASQATEPILNILSAYGQFERDPADTSGTALKWEQSEPIPGGEKAAIEAQVVVGSDNIKLTWSVDIPKKTSSLFSQQFAFLLPDEKSSQSKTPWAWVTVPGMALCVYFPLKNRRKGLLISLILLTSSLLLFSSGCGVKDLYGKINGEYIFTKIEYPEKDFSYPAKGDVYWNLSGGTNEITYDIFSEVFVDLLDESKGTVEKECITKIKYSLSGAVQKDGILTPASLKSASNSE